MLSHELCAQPPNIINKLGYLRKSAKAPIVKKLGVGCTAVDQPDAVMIDVSQLFFHIVWPCGGSITDLVGSISEHAAQYPKEAEKILVLDKHQDGSAKEHERLRRGKEETNEEYDLTINCDLPKRDVILTNTHNKRELGRILRTYNYGENVETDDDMFQHDEADITIISHVLRASSEGKNVIRVKSDDSDVFVLLVYMVYKKKIKAKVQMEKWDGTVLNINETCNNLGEKSLQILGMHALSGCDTTSYTCGKGKGSAINALSKTDLSELDTVLGLFKCNASSHYGMCTQIFSLFSLDSNLQYQWKMLD